MPGILVLTSSSGAGHDAVAGVLAKTLTKRIRGAAKVTVADPFEGPDQLSRIVRLYGAVIVRAPRLWGIAYRVTDNQRWVTAIARALEGAVGRLLGQQRPDLVISVHPLCHGAAIRALKRLGLDIPVAVMVTDLLDIHASWQDRGAALYLAPTAEAARQMVSFGCPAAAVHALGLPVADDFRMEDGSGEDMARLRTELGLDSERPVVLVSGGGEGSGPLEPAARIIVRTLPHSQVVVACGRNERLRRSLSTKGQPVRVLGFVNNMARWMHASDVVVAKAGALTVAEAVAARRPLLVISALPGQEKGNLRFVLESGIGAYAPPGPAFVRALRLLEGQDFRPALWLENMSRVDRPGAQEEIADLLLATAETASKRPSRVPAMALQGGSRGGFGAFGDVSR